MAPKSVTFRRHDHLVSVLFGDLLSHSYNITFSMLFYLVHITHCMFYENQQKCVCKPTHCICFSVTKASNNLISVQGCVVKAG